ncbi:uncharacterized protein [Spinacia oleracea]|uniref:Uncharacterized protein n=1 Tax=Spinacia oleracea TaxID=3562 RepID=A0ABM3QNE4_SPIOL|nr:uncharacterized protein LOC110789060 [Spinacia oleracea]XP_056684888.1 uncharacterized protein LOC110789060 [Spinacia oleracea]
MSKVVRARNKGLKFQVNWNINDLPIGKHSVPMMSYWGTSIRTNVPITLKTWKNVPQRLLDSLFEDVAITYNIDPKKKKWMLKKANAAWTNFKSELTRNWIWIPQMEIRTAPPKQYNFIKPNDWKEFVQSRLTKEWEEKSAAAKKSAGGHLYHQKRARRGYARFEQDVIEEMAMKRIYVSSVSRAQLWKLMRTDNKGNIQEGAKEVAKRIDYFMHQAEKGEIEDTVRLDVLSKALEEKRYGGRVRGVGV